MIKINHLTKSARNQIYVFFIKKSNVIVVFSKKSYCIEKYLNLVTILIILSYYKYFFCHLKL